METIRELQSLLNCGDIATLLIICGFTADYYIRIRKKSNVIQYFLWIFFLSKFLCTIGFIWIYLFYYKYADLTDYSLATNALREIIITNPIEGIELFFHDLHPSHPSVINFFNYNSKNNWLDYFKQSEVFNVIRLNVIISIIFGKQILSQCLIWSFFSGIFSWLIFYEIIQRIKNSLLIAALSILFLPGYLFFTSGLGKEAICMGNIMCFIFFIYRLFNYQKYNFTKLLTYLFGILIPAILIYLIRPYLFFAFLLTGLMILFIYYCYMHIKSINILLKIFFIFSFCIALIHIMGYTKYNIKYIWEEINYNRQLTQKRQVSTENIFHQGINEYEPYTYILSSPQALISTFFRPFIWESGNKMQMIASFDGIYIFFVLILIFSKTYFKNIISPQRHPSVNILGIHLLVFSVIYAVFLSYSTGSFSSLVRYKIYSTSTFLIGVMIFIGSKEGFINKKS